MKRLIDETELQSPDRTLRPSALEHKEFLLSEAPRNFLPRLAPSEGPVMVVQPRLSTSNALTFVHNGSPPKPSLVRSIGTRSRHKKQEALQGSHIGGSKAILHFWKGSTHNRCSQMIKAICASCRSRKVLPFARKGNGKQII